MLMSRDSISWVRAAFPEMQGASLVHSPGDVPPKSRDACHSAALSGCWAVELGGDSMPEGSYITDVWWGAQVLSGHVSKTDKIWGLATVVYDLSFCCPFHLLVSPLPSII